MRSLALLLGNLLALTTATAAPSFGQAVLVTQIFDRAVSESSGVAASHRGADRYWTVNDSGNEAAIYAIDRRGRTLASPVVDGLTNVDWEALDAFEIDQRAYLMIGDVGDNQGVRDYIQLHFIEEPTTLPVETLAVSWTTRLRFPTGAIDVESSFVDAEDGWVYLVTKREHPAWLWRVPLRPDTKDVIDAERLGPVANIPRPSATDMEDDPRLGRYRGQATDVAMCPDRSGVVVLTYGDAFWFSRAAEQSWAEAFAGEPVRIPMPRMHQQEGVAFTADGKGIVVTSEQWPAPLVEIRITHP